MQAHRVVALFLLSVASTFVACSCSHEPAPGTEMPMDVVPAEPLGAARQPVTAKYCAAACAAAAGQTCEHVSDACGGETNGERFVTVGGYILHCKPACAAACLHTTTGEEMCVRQCQNGPDKPPPTGQTEGDQPQTYPASPPGEPAPDPSPGDMFGGSGSGSSGDEYGDFV